MYAATTKDEGNAADGRFSAACQIDLIGILLVVDLRTVFDHKRIFQPGEAMAAAGFHPYSIPFFKNPFFLLMRVHIDQRCFYLSLKDIEDFFLFFMVMITPGVPFSDIKRS